MSSYFELYYDEVCVCDSCSLVTLAVYADINGIDLSDENVEIIKWEDDL